MGVVYVVMRDDGRGQDRMTRLVAGYLDRQSADSRAAAENDDVNHNSDSVFYVESVEVELLLS